MATQTFPITVQQLTTWKGFCQFEPERVVRLLSLPKGQPETSNGDKMEDIPAALLAVKTEASMQSPIWDQLVLRGVVPAVCQNFVAHRVQVAVMSEDPMEPVTLEEQIHSPHYPALAILSKYATTLKKQPTAVNKKFIADVQDSWDGIVSCIWNDIKSKELHAVPDIVVFAFLLNGILRAAQDAEFYLRICKPDSVVVPIIARQWASHPTKHDITALTVLFFPLNPNTRRHLDKTPTAPHVLLRHVYLGFDPEAKNAEATVSIIAQHMKSLSVDLVRAELNLVGVMLDFEQRDGPQTGFERALRRSQSFWKHSLALLVNGKASNETTKEVLGLIRSIFGIPSQAGPSQTPAEQETFVLTLIDVGFFDALDASMDRVAKVDGTTQMLTIIFESFNETIPSLSRSSRVRLNSEFPRSKTLFSLLFKDVKRQSSDESSVDAIRAASLMGDGIPPATSLFWDHAGWQTFAGLQRACVDWRRACARRGCGKGIKIRCRTCQEAGWCSKGCEDVEKEHGAGCARGWMPIVNQI